MQSEIKVNFVGDENGLQPVISIKLVDSTHTIDALLKAFFEKLGGESNWVYVSFEGESVNNGINGATRHINLIPITPGQLPDTITQIKDRIGSWQESVSE